MKTLVFAGGGLLFGGCNTVPADPLRTTYEKRDVMQEVLTDHFFMTQPHYFKWMLELKKIELRR